MAKMKGELYSILIDLVSFCHISCKIFPSSCFRFTSYFLLHQSATKQLYFFFDGGKSTGEEPEVCPFLM